MKIISFLRKLGILIAAIGVLIHFTPFVNGQTVEQGSNLGSISGLVAFAIGWALLGASLAFSAGFKYQQKKLEEEKLQPLD